MAVENVTVRVAGKERTFDSYTRGEAIKQFCKDCVGGKADDVRGCTAPLCPLYPFRPYASKNSLPPA